MELLLNNVGIIKDSSVLLDGLTVITGKNSSGKTTVGKVMYSLLSAGTKLEEAFEEARYSYVFSQLVIVERTLRIRRNRHMVFYTDGSFEDELDKVMTILAMHWFRNYDSTQLVAFLMDVKNTIESLTAEEYVAYILRVKKKDYELDDPFLNGLFEHFPEWKRKALEICYITLDLVSNEKSFLNFMKDRTFAFLNHEFNKQIKPIRYQRKNAQIELRDKNRVIVKARVFSKNRIDFSSDSTFMYPYDRCIFIDNPFVIDNLDKYDMLYHSMGGDSDKYDAERIITSEDIKDREEILVDLLINNEIKNYFDDLEIQKKFNNVFEQINKIVPGEFAKSTDGYYYIDEGARLSIKNLATGSKMFFIIKKLLLNGLIDDNTMLILDEPESHLHPEWINMFAQILVFLVANVKVNVLLTTHSANLMLALNVFARKMNMLDKSHFYLAEKTEDGYFSRIRCIDDSIGEGYSHLSLPLIEMDLELDDMNEE